MEILEYSFFSRDGVRVSLFFDTRGNEVNGSIAKIGSIDDVQITATKISGSWTPDSLNPLPRTDRVEIPLSRSR